MDPDTTCRKRKGGRSEESFNGVKNKRKLLSYRNQYRHYTTPGTRYGAHVSTHASNVSISDDVKPDTRDKNII